MTWSDTTGWAMVELPYYIVLLKLTFQCRDNKTTELPYYIVLLKQKKGKGGHTPKVVVELPYYIVLLKQVEAIG